MNLSKFTMLSLTALLFIGCSASPKDAVTGMFDALSDGDLTALQENATQNTVALLTMGSMMQCKANKNDFDSEEELASECFQQVFGNTDVENVEVTKKSDTSAYAMVTTSNNGKEKTQKLDLIKVDDTWKVNIKK